MKTSIKYVWIALACFNASAYSLQQQFGYNYMFHQNDRRQLTYELQAEIARMSTHAMACASSFCNEVYKTMEYIFGTRSFNVLDFDNHEMVKIDCEDTCAMNQVMLNTQKNNKIFMACSITCCTALFLYYCLFLKLHSKKAKNSSPSV